MGMAPQGHRLRVWKAGWANATALPTLPSDIWISVGWPKLVAERVITPVYLPKSRAMNPDAEFILDQVRRHTEWFRDSIPMIASENLMSPAALQVYLSDFGHRYAEGLPGERYYQGNTYVDQVELKVMALARELFGATYADPRPISGTTANMAILFALTEPGDIVTTVGLSHGAHISTAKFGAVGVRSVNSLAYPFNVEDMNIDVDEAIKFLKRVRPKVALFGQSVFLFPTPLKELGDALQEVGCHVWYDGAHVMGLIAGGQFQDPLREGAEVVSGSTHKTLPGPQHGIIVGRPRDEKVQRKLEKAVFPGVVSNHHLHAMAALGITLAEHKEFGRAYAAQIVANARALGQALYERGMKVLCPHLGFTRSHAIAVDVADHGGGAAVALDLEKANVIVNKNLLPWDTSPVKPSGLRLGSQEMTRIGMKEGHMDEVAEFIHRVAVKEEDPAKVAKEVREFKKDFQGIHYCFNEGKPAYHLWSVS
jgi:glycine hydroxymethyltransferase